MPKTPSAIGSPLVSTSLLVELAGVAVRLDLHGDAGLPLELGHHLLRHRPGVVGGDGDHRAGLRVRSCRRCRRPSCRRRRARTPSRATSVHEQRCGGTMGTHESPSTSFAGANRSRFKGLRLFRTLSPPASLPRAPLSCAAQSSPGSAATGLTRAAEYSRAVAVGHRYGASPALQGEQLQVGQGLERGQHRVERPELVAAPVVPGPRELPGDLPGRAGAARHRLPAQLQAGRAWWSTSSSMRACELAVTGPCAGSSAGPAAPAPWPASRGSRAAAARPSAARSRSTA